MLYHLLVICLINFVSGHTPDFLSGQIEVENVKVNCPMAGPNQLCYLLSKVEVVGSVLFLGEKQFQLRGQPIFKMDRKLNGRKVLTFKTTDFCDGALVQLSATEGRWMSGFFRCGNGNNTQLIFIPKCEGCREHFLIVDKVRKEGKGHYNKVLIEEPRSTVLAMIDQDVPFVRNVGLTFITDGTTDGGRTRTIGLGIVAKLNKSMKENNVPINFFFVAVVDLTGIWTCELKIVKKQCRQFVRDLGPQYRGDIFVCSVGPKCLAHTGEVMGTRFSFAKGMHEQAVMHEIMHNFGLGHDIMQSATALRQLGCKRPGHCTEAPDRLRQNAPTWIGEYQCDGHKPTYKGICPNYNKCHTSGDCSCLRFCELDSNCCQADTKIDQLNTCNYVGECPNYNNCASNGNCDCEQYCEADSRCCTIQYKGATSENRFGICPNHENCQAGDFSECARKFCQTDERCCNYLGAICHNPPNEDKKRGVVGQNFKPGKHFNFHCLGFECRPNDECFIDETEHDLPEGSRKCFGAGSNIAERDDSCAVGLACAQKGQDGRIWGCNGFHCCHKKKDLPENSTGCVAAGNNMKERDDACFGDLVCTRKGENGRQFGGCNEDGTGRLNNGRSKQAFTLSCCSRDMTPFINRHKNHKYVLFRGKGNKCDKEGDASRDMTAWFNAVHSVINPAACEEQARLAGALFFSLAFDSRKRRHFCHLHRECKLKDTQNIRKSTWEVFKLETSRLL